MTAKQPTNAELASKLDVIDKKVDGMDMRVAVLETKQMQEDAFKAALSQIRKEDAETSQQAQRNELYKKAGIILGLLATILSTWIVANGGKL